MLQRKLIRIFSSVGTRCSSNSNAIGSNNDISPTLNNRNPRNLERIRIGYKPNGYALDVPGAKHWHRLEVNQNTRSVTASIKHFENGTVLEASTAEWAIKKHLFKQSDTSAYINLGRILARRCLQSGITEVRCDIVPTPGGKMEKFLENLEIGGVSLKEAMRYRKAHPWERFRPEKPWEIIEKPS